MDERLILLLVHRAVDIIGAIAAWTFFVVPGLAPGHVHIDAVEIDNRRNCIEERKCIRARFSLD